VQQTFDSALLDRSSHWLTGWLTQ